MYNRFILTLHHYYCILHLKHHNEKALPASLNSKSIKLNLGLENNTLDLDQGLRYSDSWRLLNSRLDDCYSEIVTHLYLRQKTVNLV